MNAEERGMIVAALNFYVWFGEQRGGLPASWAVPFKELSEKINENRNS